MAVLGLDHVNIRTTDVDASARFYVEIFDFEFRKGPEVAGNRANWLFDRSGRPIIHFRMATAEAQSTGSIDHIALTCDDKDVILERLKTRGIQFNVFENPAEPMTQVFVKDPHGVMLELRFPQAST